MDWNYQYYWIDRTRKILLLINTYDDILKIYCAHISALRSGTQNIVMQNKNITFKCNDGINVTGEININGKTYELFGNYKSEPLVKITPNFTLCDQTAQEHVKQIVPLPAQEHVKQIVPLPVIQPTPVQEYVIQPIPTPTPAQEHVMQPAPVQKFGLLKNQPPHEKCLKKLAAQINLIVDERDVTKINNITQSIQIIEAECSTIDIDNKSLAQKFYTGTIVISSNLHEILSGTHAKYFFNKLIAILNSELLADVAVEDFEKNSEDNFNSVYDKMAKVIHIILYFYEKNDIDINVVNKNIKKIFKKDDILFPVINRLIKVKNISNNMLLTIGNFLKEYKKKYDEEIMDVENINKLKINDLVTKINKLLEESIKPVEIVKEIVSDKAFCFFKSADGNSYREKIANNNNDICDNDEHGKLNIQKPCLIDMKKMEMSSISVKTKISMKKYPTGTKKAKLYLYDGTMNQAINFFNKIGKKIVILNSADSQKIGGDYIDGAYFQEEELCRTIIDLYQSLLLNEDEQINWFNNIQYNANLNLMRNDCVQSNGKYDLLDKPVKISVITAYSPNFKKINKITSSIIEDLKIFPKQKWTETRYYNTIKQILTTAFITPIYATNNDIDTENNTLIISLFGCEKFTPLHNVQKENNIDFPQIMSSIIIDVLNDAELKTRTLYDDICIVVSSKFEKNAFNSVIGDLPFQEVK
jgi:uncharacterized protein (TIGR02452 family)